MTWIHWESERSPPPASTLGDQLMIDAEDRVTGADLGPALKAALSAALRVPSMPVPFWTIRVMLLIILLWPAADLVRMTVVTLANLMIVMRPFIPFFLGHVVRGLLRLWCPAFPLCPLHKAQEHRIGLHFRGPERTSEGQAGQRLHT